jgi:hypothetical protein
MRKHLGIAALAVMVGCGARTQLIGDDVVEASLGDAAIDRTSSDVGSLDVTSFEAEVDAEPDAEHEVDAGVTSGVSTLYPFEAGIPCTVKVGVTAGPLEVQDPRGRRARPGRSRELASLDSAILE